MATRPKPWETGQSPSTSTTAGVPPSAGTQPAAAAAGAAPNNDLSSQTGVPPVPARPTALSNVAPATSFTPGGYNSYNSGYGSGYSSGYGSGYGMGGYGSYGGGYGSYGGYGGGYGSYGGYGGGYGMGRFNGMGQAPGAMENSTAATFQLIESIVGAVGGFAQMLESTYMATHSSFFAMMSVAEQFGHLKQSLGSILGIFALLRWSRSLLAKITGKAQPPNLSVSEFAKFSGGAGGGVPRPNRPSFKPLLIFLAAAVGFPLMIGRLVRSMANQAPHGGTNAEGEVVDPSQLEFCRALYDFVPENPQIELQLKNGDLLAILSTQDPSGSPSQWWRVRSRDGRTGYVPSTYVEVIPKQQGLPAPAAETTKT